MGQLLEMPNPKFSRTAITTSGKRVIISICNACGRRRLVAFRDGSLQTWERGHACGIVIQRSHVNQ